MTPKQCRQARDLLDVSIYALAKASNAGFEDVRLFEEGQLPESAELGERLRPVLEAWGAMFTPAGVSTIRKRRSC